MRVLRWLSSDRAELIFCLDCEFVFSAPLALGLISPGSQGGSLVHESGCHCRGWTRRGTGRRAVVVGQDVAGMWLRVHPWRRSLRTEVGYLNSLSAWCWDRKNCQPFFHTCCYLSTFCSLELKAAAFPVINICFLICTFGILSLFLKMHLVSLNFFSQKGPLFIIPNIHYT